MDRLRLVWSQVVFLSKTAQKLNSLPPTTKPSNPAPGRRFLILRDDSQVPPSQLLTFDSLTSAAPSGRTIATKMGSFFLSSSDHALDPADTTASSASAMPGEKKRWGLFRNVKLPGNRDNDAIALKENESPPRSEAGESAEESQKDLLKPKLSKDLGEMEARTMTGREHERTKPDPPGRPPNARSSFRFSLEWVEKSPNMVRSRPPYLPRLPEPAEKVLSLVEPKLLDDVPVQLQTTEFKGKKYVGRALSEWALVVSECQTFFDRRKSEGVLSDAHVETPTLGVDWFRRFG